MRRRRQSDRRIRLLVLLLSVLGLSLVRAVWLQTVRAQGLGELASSQQHETVAIPAGRGALLDRMGVQLAIGEEATSVYANPKTVVNPRAVAVAAGKALGVDPDVPLSAAVDESKGFVYVSGKRIQRKRRRSSAHLSGLGFLPENAGCTRRVE